MNVLSPCPGLRRTGAMPTSLKMNGCGLPRTRLDMPSNLRVGGSNPSRHPIFPVMRRGVLSEARFAIRACIADPLCLRSTPVQWNTHDAGITSKCQSSCLYKIQSPILHLQTCLMSVEKGERGTRMSQRFREGRPPDYHPSRPFDQARPATGLPIGTRHNAHTRCCVRRQLECPILKRPFTRNSIVAKSEIRDPSRARRTRPGGSVLLSRSGTRTHQKS